MQGYKNQTQTCTQAISSAAKAIVEFLMLAFPGQKEKGVPNL